MKNQVKSTPKQKRPRIVKSPSNKIQAIEELAETFKISYGYAYHTYVSARNYCRVFNDKSILQVVEETLSLNGKKLSKVPVNPFN